MNAARNISVAADEERAPTDRAGDAAQRRAVLSSAAPPPPQPNIILAPDIAGAATPDHPGRPHDADPRADTPSESSPTLRLSSDALARELQQVPRDAAQPLPAARRREQLAALRRKVARLQAQHRPAAPRVATGCPPLDDALGGGLATRALHELIPATPHTPVWSLGLALAARLAESRWLVCLDATDELYPPALAQRGLPLDRLLIVRSRRAADQLWVCEQVLRCRASGVLVAAPHRLDLPISRRLQLAAESGDSTALLIRPPDLCEPTFAASRLQIAASGADPVRHAAPQRAARPAPESEGLFATTSPDRRRLFVNVLKLRDGAPSGPIVWEWSDAPGALSAPAASAHRAHSSPRPAVAG